ncbi:MAG TPA: signal recognition particle protein [Kiritimatiellia bacterium]|nr:signal recognition particle protein [Kiritimatiellia bacterium]
MFDRITASLQKVFRNLRGFGKLSESNIKEALREIRLALLEADVNFEVVRDFISRVKEKCLGVEVMESVTPGQQVVKHVHDEMVTLLGGQHREFDLSKRPAAILLLGLNGAGKTTTSGKLALRWKKEGKRVLLVACDLRRPAAVDQLRILAKQVGVEAVAPMPGDDLRAVATKAIHRADEVSADIVLFDTDGRFQVDAELVQELKELKAVVNPSNTVLVLDAAAGQEAVHVAETFHKEIGLTGLILTKLDGDARGGAALSVQAVTHCPILLVGMGERPEDLEPFYPDRMASRILGMGDVVSLVEKAREAIDDREMEQMQRKLMEDRFTLEDFLTQIQQVRKLGPVENLLEMLPGLGNVPAHAREGLLGLSEKDFGKTEAIIRSMTVQERRNPDVMDGRRRLRIAKGSGTDVRDVNELLKNFAQARKMAAQFRKAQKRLIRLGK